MFGVIQGVPDLHDPKAEARWARRTLILLVAGGLALRLVVAFWAAGHGPDLQAFKSWCIHVARVGPRDFFTASGESPTIAVGLSQPLYVLLLWPLGLAWKLLDPTFESWRSPLFSLLVRLPCIAGDLLCVLAVHRLAARYVPPRRALATGALLYLNPALIVVSSVWGQTDSLIAGFVLAGTAALIEGWIAAGVLLTGAAALVHAHAVVFLPLALALAVRRGRTVAAIQGLGALAVTALAVSLLLAPAHGMKLFTGQLSAHPHTTSNAFNLWFVLVGNTEPDGELLIGRIGLSRHAAGLLLLMAVVGSSAIRVAARDSDVVFMRELALTGLGAFLLATRVHERWLLYPVAVLVLFPGFRTEYATLSATLLANCLWALGASASWGKAVEGGWGMFLAAVNLLAWVRVAWQPAEDPASDLDYAPYAVDVSRPAKPWLERERESEDTGVVALDRRDLALMLVLTLAFGGLRHHNLAAPADLIFDEVYHAKAGEEIYAGKAPNEWVHPPLAKLIIGLGIKAHGMNSYGWRFMPWLAGTLVLPLLYILSRNVIPDRRFAVLGALLLALDGCYFVLSRTAMTNVFAVFFEVATLTLFLLYLKQASRPAGRLGHGWYLLGTSLMASLGVSTRWTCLWLLAFVAATYGLHTIWAFRMHTRHLSASGAATAFVLATLSGVLHFVLIPGAIYLASYYPLVKWGCYPDYRYVVGLQPQIWKFHTTFTTHHPYYSEWYTWCFTRRPVWYHYKDEKGIVTGILALGNPVLWWITVPGVILAAWVAWRERDALAAFPSVAWAALYLPWVLSPRTLNYSHYYLEPVAYACVAIAGLLYRAWKKDRSFWMESAAVVALVALAFAFFYPLYSCTPLPRDSYSRRIWSSKWI
jgi:predicted membrane-bound dolichyl-phosphate-mannose-protein mannosyltransferase